MALIRCSECGRTISDKASVCIGCGAPLARAAGMNLVPERSRGPPPTRNQILYRAGASVLALVIGVAGSALLARRAGAADRTLAIIAALLVVFGLCGTIVTAAQLLMLRRPRSSR